MFLLLNIFLVLSPMYKYKDKDMQTAVIPVALYVNKALCPYEDRI
jgi:hypothetical protein